MSVHVMWIGDAESGNEVLASCEHGEVDVLDENSQWSEDQLVRFTLAVLNARMRCRCNDERTWLPACPPEGVTVSVRAFELDQADPDVDVTRPDAIPPLAVSKAAERVFETCIPVADHDLRTDWRLVRWWYGQRQLGLLRGE